MDRTELAAAMEAGTQVRVTEPQGAAWTGRITGLTERGMTLLTEHGHSAYLPQSCEVEIDATAEPVSADEEFATWLLTLDAGRGVADDAVPAAWLAEAAAWHAGEGR